VGIHGYVRATNDLDIWLRMSPSNASAAVEVLRQFGFGSTDLTEDLFLEKGNAIRMGVPPMRLELLTSIAGVEFEDCYRERLLVDLGDLVVPVISLDRLRQNKRAAGRAKICPTSRIYLNSACFTSTRAVCANSDEINPLVVPE
jgi:hypothetical protein